MSVLDALEPERTPECVSDYAFDRWLAGHAAADQRLAIEQHVASCARCSARQVRLQGEREAWRARPVPAALGASPKPKRVALPAAAAALALAAAAMLIVRGGPVAPEEGVRSKGPQSIGFYVKHGDGVRRGAHGEVVEPGDALRFLYTSEEDGFIAVLSVDAAQRGAIYYPDEQANAAAIAAGRDVPLPLSTVLDDVTGPEQIFGVFCASPVELEPLRRALERDASAAPPPGCRFDQLSIEKRRR